MWLNIYTSGWSSLEQHHKIEKNHWFGEEEKMQKKEKKTIIGYIQKKTRGKKQTFLGFSQLPILSAWQLSSQKE